MDYIGSGFDCLKPLRPHESGSPMGGKTMRMNGFAVLAASVCVAALATPAQAQARSFNISAGNLRSALDAFGRQSGKPIIYKVDELRGLRSNGYRGSAEPQAALDAILAGTGMAARFSGSGAVAIVKAGNGQTATSSSSSGARVDAGSPAVEDESTDADIVVTAQKSSERLLDVPVPVTVVATGDLSKTGQTRLEDFYSKVPGMSFAITGDGNRPFISIRGIATGGLTSPTVGIVIDDVPYGLTVSPSISPSAPDIDPGDLARIEVLKGPQGTLYGASSLGGLLKFVTIDPSTDRISGRLQVGAEGIKYGDDIGYTVRGAINIPLSKTFAIRASGFKMRTAGYIDNVQSGEDDVNDRVSEGGRIAALWRPTETFSLKLNAMFQNSVRGGTSDIDTTITSEEPAQAFIVGTGFYRRKTLALSAIANADIGPFELTSLTGYNDDKIAFGPDLTLALGFAANAGDGVIAPEIQRIKKFSQELRADVPVADGLNWLVGAIYVDEKASDIQSILTANPTTGQPTAGGTLGPGPILDYTARINYREISVFTNVTIDVTDRFDIQIGGRWANSRSVLDNFTTGSLTPLIYPDNPHILPPTEARNDAFTYLFTPRFRISADLMIYGRIASSFRPAAPNPTSCGLPGFPCQVGADRTRNYEIGVKGSAFDRRFTFDLSAYYIDWKDIQLELAGSAGGLSFSYQDNAGDARSKGVEVTLEAKPWRGMTISATGAYNDGKLVALDPRAGIGKIGDRLPFSSKWSGSIGLTQEFNITPELRANVGGAASFVDNRFGRLRAPGSARAVFPGYTQVDLRAGLEYNQWSLDAYVNNLTNSRGLLRGGPDAINGFQNLIVYTQPRTIGVTLAKRF